MKKQNDSGLWFLVLAASLLLNAYFLFHKNKDKAGEIFATAGGQSFRWKDVSEQGQQIFRQMDISYYLLMRSEAEQWAASYVLPKEAKARGVTVEELLKTEVIDKVQAEKVEDKQRDERYYQREREYLKELFERYGVRFNLVVPKSFDEKEVKG